MNNEKLIRLPKEVERIDLEKTTFMEDSTSNVELPMVDEKLELVSEQYNEIASNKIPQLQGQLEAMGSLENFEIRSNKRLTEPLVVITIDDGGIHDYQTLLPIFKKYGFVASSGIITGQVENPTFPYTMTWNQIRELNQVHGWEIVSHATRDVNLTTLTASEIETELKTAKNALLNKGFECRNLFLPQGKYNETVKQVARGIYRAVRVSGQASTGAMINISPFDMYQIDSKFFGDSNGIGGSIDGASGKPVDTVDYFKYYIDLAKNKNGVLCIGMHSNALQQNNRMADLDLICQYIQSQGIKVVTFNEMLNRVGNVVDTTDFKVGANGKIGGLYGKIKVGGFNEVLHTTPIKDIDSGYMNVSTVGNNQGIGLPLDTGGTMITVKPDNDVGRAFEIMKPYGRDKGLYVRDFADDEINEWQKLDNVYTHPLNSLPSNHVVLDLKSRRINYCTIQTASASGYPENSAGLLIANFNATLNTLVKEEYHINNSARVYDRYWNGSAWSAWILRNFDDNFKAKLNQSYTTPNIVSGRATNVVGGYIKIENMVYVNVKFTSAITGNDVLPLNAFPYSTVATAPQVALSCVNVTDKTTAYAVMGITSGGINCSLTSGKEYVISGMYPTV